MCKDTNPSNEQETIKCSGIELESGYRQSGERRVVQAGTVCNINHRVSDWLIRALIVTCLIGRIEIRRGISLLLVGPARHKVYSSPILSIWLSSEQPSRLTIQVAYKHD